MYYCQKLGRGIRKDSIPKPNPRKVELPKSSTFNDIVDLANELYFGNGADPSRMELADSSGLSIHVNKSEWKLDSYYKNNNYQPSRHKLYLMYDNEGVSLYVCMGSYVFM